MEDDVRRVLDYYALGELQAVWRIEHGFINENWVVETDRGHYFVKCRHPDLRQPGVIRAQHALVAHLRKAGFPAPIVVPAVGGETFLLLDGEVFEVQEYVKGDPYDRNRPAQFREAALMLGLYHARVQGFVPQALRDLGELYTPAVLRTNLTKLIGAWEFGSNLAQIARQLEAHADDLAGRFAGHGALPHLVIHGDYYAGNLLFDRNCGGDRIIGVVDYDKARWQPRVVELAEALIYFASPRPGHLKHLVYPGVLEWEPLTRFLHHYVGVITLDESEARALPDYVRCIWLSVSLQRLLEKGPRPAKALEPLQEVLALGDWAVANAGRMTELCNTITKERK